MSGSNSSGQSGGIDSVFKTMKLISKKTTYELTPQELTTLLAEVLAERNLALPGQKVDVTYRVSDISDDRYGCSSSYDLTKIIISLETE